MEEEKTEEKKVEGTEEVTTEEKKTPNLIEEAKIVNTKKEELLDREEKLQTRKEKLHAEEMVAGKGQMTDDAQEETPKDYGERMLKGD